MIKVSTTVKIIDGTDVDVKDCTRDELVEIKYDLIDKKAYIDDQLAEAHVNVRKRQEYSDPDWYRRARSASRLIGRDIMRVDRELRARKIAYQKRFERAFMDSAYKILDKETYDKIMDLTNEKVGTGEIHKVKE